MTSTEGAPVRNPDLLRAVLIAGLTWLYETEQLDAANVTHHGPVCHLHDRLAVGFAPLPDPVVIIDVADAEWDNNKIQRELLNPLTEGECNEVVALLGELGHKVIDRWNGAGCETGSFRLAGPIHPTLEAARKRYQAGCQEHPEERVFCKCEGFRAGFAAAVKPTWPEMEPSSTRPNPGGAS